MKRLTVILFLSRCLATAGAQNFSFTYDGQVRSYIVHLPTGYSPATQYPLVFNFHGYTSNASQQMLYSGMNSVADSNHFIVVYPDGLNNAWNVGFGFGAYGTGVDDVGFTNALIDTMLANYSVNPARIYSCGMSNGGYMSYRLACELENRIAAIASVTGSMTDSTAFYCNTSRYVPVMQVHGTADPVVNYSGAVQSMGIEAMLAYWYTANGCTLPPDSAAIPNSNTADSTTVDRIWYDPCNGGSEVLFYRVNGGGHTWPGGIIDIPSYGYTNRDINASSEIWKFFNRFTINGPLGTEDPGGTANIRVYPNPVQDQLQIMHDGSIQRWSVWDVSGRLWMQGTYPGNSIQMQPLNAGIYFLRLQTASGAQVVRLVKQ